MAVTCGRERRIRRAVLSIDPAQLCARAGRGRRNRYRDWRVPDSLDEQLKSWMTHYHHVPSVVDVGVMTDAAVDSGKVWVDRLEATIESHTLTAAKVRENCTIPGTSVRTAWLCRDKPSMKEALRAAGVPTAASRAAHTADEVYEFADAVGFR